MNRDFNATTQCLDICMELSPISGISRSNLGTPRFYLFNLETKGLVQSVLTHILLVCGVLFALSRDTAFNHFIYNKIASYTNPICNVLVELLADNKQQNADQTLSSNEPSSNTDSVSLNQGVSAPVIVGIEKGIGHDPNALKVVASRTAITISFPGQSKFSGSWNSQLPNQSLVNADHVKNQNPEKGLLGIMEKASQRNEDYIREQPTQPGVLSYADNTDGDDKTIHNTGKLDDMLWLTAAKGDLDLFRRLLDNGANEEACGPEGKRPLHMAARNGHQGIVKLLLGLGAPVSVPDENGMTPLHFAAEGGHSSIVLLLLQYRAKTNTGRFRDRMTELHLAAEHGHSSVIKVLLSHGAGVEYRDRRYMTPLDRAARNGHLQAVKLLLKECAKGDYYALQWSTALDFATILDTEERELIVYLLLERLPECKYFMDSVEDALKDALEIMCRRGKDSIVRVLLKHGAKADASSALKAVSGDEDVRIIHLLANSVAVANNPPTLEFAPRWGTNDIACILLAAGVNLDTCTVLKAALEGGSMNIVRLLLENDAAAGYHHSALEYASCHGNQNQIRMLLDAGTDADSCDALTAAAAGGDIEIVYSLLDSGAVVYHHLGAVRVAAACGHMDILQVMLDRAKTKKGNKCILAALCASAKAGKADIVRFLLDSYPDFYYGNSSCLDAIAQDAVLSGNVETVELLLERGARVDVNASVDYYGIYLMKFAALGNYSMAKFLLCHGSKTRCPLPADKKAFYLSGKECNALICACIGGNSDIVKLLLERDDGLLDGYSSWGTALDTAAAHCRENLAVQKALFDHNTRISKLGQTSRYDTLLQSEEYDRLTFYGKTSTKAEISKSIFLENFGQRRRGVGKWTLAPPPPSRLMGVYSKRHSKKRENEDLGYMISF
ncbi:MAG: hypothetical protein M1834_003306 [Cirrosporium novae-zelandiae]|nr:MAG: hypothetical protein M1834_003306 [Cirrosporium novae-zelandiae]